MDEAAIQALRSAEGARLLRDLPPYDEGGVLALSRRLRAEHPAELVSAALTQQRLRHRARPKFGEDAARMFFTPQGLEQATRVRVATHRARRFTAAGRGRVADLCCGVGGDAIALARGGASVLAVERDPLTAAVAGANAEALGLADRIEVRVGDARTADTAGCDAAFCDPARRDRSGRVFDPDAYEPPLPFVLDLAARFPHAAVKVAPGVPHARVPADAEVEWVSDDGELKEAVLWFGGLRSVAGRRATLLPSGAALVDDPALGAPPVGPVGRWLHEPDGAVVRAHLVAEAAAVVGAHLIDPTIAYITSDRLVPSPLTVAYEVLDVMPFGLKRLRTYLRDRAVGRLTVKKRGSAVDPDRLRRQLRLTGPHEATIVLTRVAGAPVVLVVERVRP